MNDDIAEVNLIGKYKVKPVVSFVLMSRTVLTVDRNGVVVPL